MEIAKWQKLILAWVNSSGLPEKPVKFLDQTDLPAFYAEYRRLMVKVSVPETDIRDFLRVHYPAFQTHLHSLEDNEICKTDYVYVYCLLLHFACVVCKEQIYQRICMTMSSTEQELIALLFSRLVEKETITRASLKNTLRETAAASAIEFMKLESPIRTPLKPSPATPSTKLLEDRSRELITLKANLETERYERNFVELQMKDLEEKLNRANQQQKSYLLEIKQLKEKLLYGDEQNIPQNCEKKDVFSIANHRDVKQLEDKIWALNSEMEVMMRERNNLQQKNAIVEKELSNVREKWHEGQIRNENINAELEEKMIVIAHLESVNEELKMFIHENKSPNQDLNSTDSLDYSFGSSSSKLENPESLAKTVVDIQLREKECENQTLRNTLAAKHEELLKISQEFVAFMNKNSSAIDVEIPKITSNDDNLQYVAFTLMNAMEKLVEKEAEMRRTLGKAEVEQGSLVDTIARLNDECTRMNEEMSRLVDQEKATREDLVKANESLDKKCRKFENICKEFQELRADYDSASRELSCQKTINARYEDIIEESEKTENELACEISQLKSKLMETENELKDVLQKLVSLEKKFSESQQALQEKQESLNKSQASSDLLTSQNSVLTAKISELNSKVASLQQSKEHQQVEMSKLRDEMGAQVKENDQLKANMESVSFEKEELKAEIDTKIQDLKELSALKENSGVKILSLEQSIADLRKEVDNFATDKQELRKNLDKAQQDNETLAVEKIAMEDKLKDAENQLEDLRNEITNFEAQEIEFSKQIDTLKVDIEVFKSDVRKNQTRKDKLERQVEEQKTQMVHLQKEIDCHMLDIETLRDTLKEKDALLEKNRESQVISIAEIERKKCQLEEKVTQQDVLHRESQEIIGKLEHELQESKDRISKLVEEQDNLQREYSELQNEKHKNLEELQMLTGICTDTKKKLEKATAESESLAKIYEKLGTMSSSESSDVFEQIHSIQEQLHIKDSTINDLGKKMELIKQDSSALSHKVSESEEKITELLKEIDTNAKLKEEMLKHHTEELSSLQRALSETYKKNEDLTVALKDGEASRKHTEDLFEAEKVEKLSLKSKLTETVNENESLAAKLVRAEEIESNLKEELRTLQDDLKERKMHCMKLVSDIDELKGEKEKEVNHLNTQLSLQKSENDALRDEKQSLEKLKTDVKEQAAKIQELEASEVALKNQVEKLSQEVTEKENSLAEKEKALKIMEVDLEKELAEEKSLNQTRLEKNESLEKTVSEMKSLQEDLVNLQDQLTAKESSNSTLTDEITKMRDILSSKTSAVEQLTEKLEASNEAGKLSDADHAQEISKLKEGIAELQKNLEEKCSELHKMEEDRKIVNERARELLDTQQDFATKCTQYEDRIQQLNESKAKAIDVLQKEITGLEKRNIDLSANFKILESTVSEKVRQCTEFEEENVKLREEIQSIEFQNDEITQKLLDHDGEIHDLQNEIKKLLTAKHELQKTFDGVSARKTILEESLMQKEAEIANLTTEMNKKSTEFSADSAKIATLLQEIEKYKCLEDKVRTLESLENKEKTLNEQLVNDVAILQAKLFKERQALVEKEAAWALEKDEFTKRIAENINADERINENRREMEGKLEKMKQKMKTLCNAEIEKLRLKYEHDCAQKVEKVESTSRKLSKEIAILNTKNLDLMKENTNLKRMTGSTYALSKPPIPPMSLDMEDEEGEQFNNTYLKDMKYGADHPLFGRESVTKEELEYRNSMVPPHLKSQYAAQYGNLDDDAMSIGETNVHEDSMSSLLYAGQRKKMSGTTSYKRPGPPTPSKNGGRLSFGGTTGEVHPRQILREMNESTKQTPSTLRTLFGRKSLARDEVKPSHSVVSDACLGHDGCNDDVSSDETSTSSKFATPMGSQKKSTTKRQRVSHLKNRRFSDVLQTQKKKLNNSFVRKSKSRRSAKFDELRQMNDDEDASSTLWISEPKSWSAERKFEKIALEKISQTPFVGMSMNAAQMRRRFSTPIHIMRSSPASVHSSAKCSGGLSISERIPRSEVIRLPRRQLIQSKKESNAMRFSIIFATTLAIIMIVFSYFFNV